MKLNGIFASFLTGASLLTVSNIEPLKASCEGAPPTGDKLVITGPNSWKIRSTVRQSITSNNERKVSSPSKN